MLAKEEFLKQIIEGIKAGRLDPCNDVVFGEIDTNRPQYYWTVENGQVVEESPFYVDDEQPEFRFGVSIADVENVTEKDFGELSDREVKQAMLDVVGEYGVDDWYDQYQQEV